jgi:ferric-dicitrate binding protein FerR (iron transport regulator)
MEVLLVKYLLQEATPVEQQQVETWLAQSEANRKELEHLEFVWKESEKAAVISTVNEQEAWQRFKELRNGKKTAPVISIANPKRWLQIAAAVIVLLAGGWWANIYLNANTNRMEFVQAQQTVTADTLPDGSIVTLNKNSSIEYKAKFTRGTTRAVKLKGEAFFNVTGNKEKPFVITVNDAEIKVVGTSFNIKSINGQTEVIVKTGIVEVTRNGKTIRLSPNEKLITPVKDTVLVKTTVTDKLYDYYQSKEFVCDNTPLWRLVEVLNEAYQSNVIIGRNELRNLRLNTTFNNESLENVLDIIAKTFQLQVVKTGNQIILQ